MRACFRLEWVLQRQTLNNSYELNAASVLMQLEDNVQEQKILKFSFIVFKYD
jgi:hypothetical protein